MSGNRFATVANFLDYLFIPIFQTPFTSAMVFNFHEAVDSDSHKDLERRRFVFFSLFASFSAASSKSKSSLSIGTCVPRRFARSADCRLKAHICTGANINANRLSAFVQRDTCCTGKLFTRPDAAVYQSIFPPSTNHRFNYAYPIGLILFEYPEICLLSLFSALNR